MRSTAKISILMVVGMILQNVVMLVTGVFVANMIGSTSYGATNLMRTLFQTAIIVAPLGLDISLQKYVSSALEGDRRIWDNVVRLRLFTFAATAAFVLLLIIGAGSWLENDVYHIAHFAEYLTVTFLVLPLSADLGILGGVLRGRFNPEPHILTNFYFIPMLRSLLLFLFLVTGWDLLGVLMANAVSVFGAWLFLNAFLMRTRPFPIHVFDRPRAHWFEALAMIGPSLWMAASVFLYGSLRTFDVIILGTMWPMKDVGEYAVLSIVAQLVQLFPFALSQTLGPTLARAHEKGDYNQLEKSLSRYLRQSSLLAAPIFGGAVVWGGSLNLVFGKSFHFSWEVSSMLALGYLVGGMLGCVGFALSMTGRHRAETVILALGNIVSVILCLLFARRGGQFGVASAVFAGFLFINFFRYVVVARCFGIVPGSLADLIPAPLCVLAGLLSRQIVSIFINQNITWLIVCGLLYIAIVVSCFWFLLLLEDEKRRIVNFAMRLLSAVTIRNRGKKSIVERIKLDE